MLHNMAYSECLRKSLVLAAEVGGENGVLNHPVYLLSFYAPPKRMMLTSGVFFWIWVFKENFFELLDTFYIRN